MHLVVDSRRSHPDRPTRPPNPHLHHSTPHVIASPSRKYGRSRNIFSTSWTVTLAWCHLCALLTYMPNIIENVEHLTCAGSHHISPLLRGPHLFFNMVQAEFSLPFTWREAPGLVHQSSMRLGVTRPVVTSITITRLQLKLTSIVPNV